MRVATERKIGITPRRTSTIFGWRRIYKAPRDVTALRGIGVAIGMVAVLALAGGTTAAAAEASAVPTKLVGRWTRTITLASSGGLLGTGVWSIVITKSGTLRAYQPGGGTSPAVTTTVFAFADGRLIIGSPEAYCKAKGQYRWKVTGKLLTITKVKDALCPTRSALFTGTWRRK